MKGREPGRVSGPVDARRDRYDDDESAAVTTMVHGRLGAAVVAAAILATPAAATGDRAPAGEGSAFGQYLAGRYARSIGDTASASRYYERVLRRDPGNPDILNRAFFLMLADGRFESAAALARRIEKAGGRSSLAKQVIAVEHFARGEAGQALTVLREASRARMNALAVPLVEAWSLVGAGRGEEALETLASLAETKGYAPFRTYHEALVNDFLGRTPAAEDAYRRTIDAQEGGSFRTVEAFGAFLERAGRRPDAIGLYRGFLAREPGNLPILAALERVESGRPPAPAVLDAREGMAEAFHGIAAGLSGRNARDSALVYAWLALALKPDMPVALFLVGRIMERDGRHAAANELYARIDAGSPHGWTARLRTAFNLDDMDELPAAADLLRRLEEERPERIDALVALGDILRAREEYEAAADAYSRAIRRVDELRKRHWTLLYSRAIAYERSSQWSKAEPDFLRALDLEPDQPLVLNYLGYSWIDRGERLERARAMVEKAVELRPADGYIVDSLGWALYRLGKFDDAVEQLERAVGLRPEDPVINDHLGDALWRVGRELEATFQWRRALTLEPEPEAVPKIREKLEKGLPPVSRPDDTDFPDGSYGD